MDTKEKNKVPDYMKPYLSGVSHIRRYQERECQSQFGRDIMDRFICLKDFSSSTPVIHSATFDKSHQGGGFYFRFAGHGIVVDPGIGFITQMHNRQIYISDVDTVIVTHAHVDHNNDVRLLSALNHEYKSSQARERAFFEKFFHCNSDRCGGITWYMDGETILSTKEILKGQKVIPLSECCDAAQSLAEGIALAAVHTDHIKDSQETYGIRLHFDLGDGGADWGYTSDTRYFKDLDSFFRDLQVLIFNISDAHRADVEDKQLQKWHLGYNGSLRLLNAVKPELALASEFRCTIGDNRFEIVKSLNKQGESRTLPANPGLSMDITGKRVCCSSCGRYVEIDRVRAVRPRSAYEEIEYICEDCLI